MYDVECDVGWAVRAGAGIENAALFSSHCLPWVCGKGLSSKLTACFHIITAFSFLTLLSMLSKMFCHVLTEPVALIIHNAITLLLPPSVVSPFPDLIYYPLYCSQRRPFYHCHICGLGDEIYLVVAGGARWSCRSEASRTCATDFIFFSKAHLCAPEYPRPKYLCLLIKYVIQWIA